MGQSSPVETFPTDLKLIKQVSSLSFYESGSQQYVLLQLLLDSLQLKQTAEALLGPRIALTQTKKHFYVPHLAYFKKQQYTLCNQFTTLRLLFQHPSKNLTEEIANRLSSNSIFGEGQIWMIAYCIIMSLIEYRSYRAHYEVKIKEQNIFIDKKGSIIFSDLNRFEEQLKNIRSQAGSIQMKQLKQLGSMLERILSAFPASCYSANLNLLMGALLDSSLKTYDQALEAISSLKKKSTSTSSQNSVKKISSSTSITRIISSKSKKKSIAEPYFPVEEKQPERVSMRRKSYLQPQESNEMSQGTNQFSGITIRQLRSTMSTNSLSTCRVEDMSSIVSTNKLTEEDEAAINQILQNYKENIPEEEDAAGRRNMKLLIYNPRDIIYEESQNDISDLNSHRTTAHHTRQPSLSVPNESHLMDISK